MLRSALEAGRICPGLALHLFTDAKRPFWKKTLRTRLRARCGRAARKRARVARCEGENRDSDRNTEAIQQGLGAALYKLINRTILPRRPAMCRRNISRGSVVEGS